MHCLATVCNRLGVLSIAVQPGRCSAGCAQDRSRANGTLQSMQSVRLCAGRLAGALRRTARRMHGVQIPAKISAGALPTPTSGASRTLGRIRRDFTTGSSHRHGGAQAYQAESVRVACSSQPVARPAARTGPPQEVVESCRYDVYAHAAACGTAGGLRSAKQPTTAAWPVLEGSAPRT